MKTNAAEMVVYGKIFTSEGNQIVEAFAVKDGKFVYVGDKKGVENFIDAGKTEIIDYTGKGLVMPSCGTGTHIILMLSVFRNSARQWTEKPLRKNFWRKSFRRRLKRQEKPARRLSSVTAGNF